MHIKPLLLAALGAAALVAPITASAQAWGGGYAGDWRDHQGFRGYPEFRDEKAHIRGEIFEGRREGWLDRAQAGDLLRRLQWVQGREAREFYEHGDDLPYWDRQQIQASLDAIDRAVDRARDEAADGDDAEWR